MIITHLIIGLSSAFLCGIKRKRDEETFHSIMKHQLEWPLPKFRPQYVYCEKCKEKFLALSSPVRDTEINFETSS